VALSSWREAQFPGHISLADVSIWRNLKRIDNFEIIRDREHFLKRKSNLDTRISIVFTLAYMGFGLRRGNKKRRLEKRLLGAWFFALCRFKCAWA
jgi:hypothetical protein